MIQTLKKISIIGYGEIGQAIKKLYPYPVKTKDLNEDIDLTGTEIMHICIPYGDFFISSVCNYIDQYSPETTIIHSTIPPLTTQTVIQKTKARVFHSPVVGIHPYLLEGLLTSTKYIGADTPCDDIVDHFKSLGVSTKVVSSKTSELAKLLSTSYYGLCIAWHGEMKKMCDKLDVNFEEAVTNWNNNYNTTYKKLRKPNVIRPTLYPPKKIGGHCVIPNAEILNNLFESPALDLILKYK